jgi:hypothetical protein
MSFGAMSEASRLLQWPGMPFRTAWLVFPGVTGDASQLEGLCSAIPIACTTANAWSLA